MILCLREWEASLTDKTADKGRKQGYVPIASNDYCASPIDNKPIIGNKVQGHRLNFGIHSAPQSCTYLSEPAHWVFGWWFISWICLRVKEISIWIKTSRLNLVEALWKHLISSDFHLSVIDPCCVIWGSLVLLCYVDGCLLFCSDSNNEIDKIIIEVKQKFNIEDQGVHHILRLMSQLQWLMSNSSVNYLNLILDSG